MRWIGLFTLGALILAVGASAVVLADSGQGTPDLVAADQPQPVPGRGAVGGQAQMGPAVHADSSVPGRAAPTTPDELLRRQQQLDRVNRSPGRPPQQQPDAPAQPPGLGTQSPSPRQPARAADCQVVPIFAPLLAVLPAIGDCLDDALIDPVSGDLVQATTGGQLVQRATDGSVAFSDGRQTWVLAPGGLEAVLVGDV